MSTITWISGRDPVAAFPSATQALAEPNGLLCAGGDLSPQRLLYAYAHGIFPWYEEGQPLLWWSPNPRCVIDPNTLHRSRRLNRFARSSNLEVSFNTNFSEVILACAEDREGMAGTWITNDMIEAYTQLHSMGWAHSVEMWNHTELVGGLYGLSIGRVFFGESMFSRVSNASKLAMAVLCHELQERKFTLFDCQVESSHLMSLGATLMARSKFLGVLQDACNPATKTVDWPEERRNLATSLKI
jgi:leucyl/phenylalanyl-tRNA--protein transferase